MVDLAGKRPPQVLPGASPGPGSVTGYGVAFTHRRPVLAAGAGPAVLLWDPLALWEASPELRHGVKVESVQFLPDSRHFLTLGRESLTNHTGQTTHRTSLKLWAVDTLRMLAAVTNDAAPIENRI
ncbi:MAG TPA: hypothetical protein PKE47_09435, partial [Verrucomicrobiota bacterium]|nr:hypothetical protein [Verrucomicrobiota bacterium]